MALPRGILKKLIVTCPVVLYREYQGQAIITIAGTTAPEIAKAFKANSTDLQLHMVIGRPKQKQKKQ